MTPLIPILGLIFAAAVGSSGSRTREITMGGKGRKAWTAKDYARQGKNAAFRYFSGDREGIPQPPKRGSWQRKAFLKGWAAEKAHKGWGYPHFDPLDSFGLDNAQKFKDPDIWGWIYSAFPEDARMDPTADRMADTWAAPDAVPFTEEEALYATAFGGAPSFGGRDAVWWEQAGAEAYKQRHDRPIHPHTRQRRPADGSWQRAAWDRGQRRAKYTIKGPKRRSYAFGARGWSWDRILKAEQAVHTPGCALSLVEAKGKRALVKIDHATHKWGVLRPGVVSKRDGSGYYVRPQLHLIYRHEADARTAFGAKGQDREHWMTRGHTAYRGRPEGKWQREAWDEGHAAARKAHRGRIRAARAVELREEGFTPPRFYMSAEYPEEFGAVPGDPEVHDWWADRTPRGWPYGNDMFGGHRPGHRPSRYEPSERNALWWGRRGMQPPWAAGGFGGHDWNHYFRQGEEETGDDGSARNPYKGKSWQYDAWEEGARFADEEFHSGGEGLDEDEDNSFGAVKAVRGWMSANGYADYKVRRLSTNAALAQGPGAGNWIVAERRDRGWFVNPSYFPMDGRNAEKVYLHESRHYAPFRKRKAWAPTTTLKRTPGGFGGGSRKLRQQTSLMAFGSSMALEPSRSDLVRVSEFGGPTHKAPTHAFPEAEHIPLEALALPTQVVPGPKASPMPSPVDPADPRVAPPFYQAHGQADNTSWNSAPYLPGTQYSPYGDAARRRGWGSGTCYTTGFGYDPASGRIREVVLGEQDW